MIQDLERKLAADDPYKSVDWERLLDADPVEYQRQQLRYQRWQGQQRQAQEALQAERQQAAQRLQQVQAATHRQRLQGLQEWVRQQHPEWADPEKGPPLHEAMMRTATQAGWTPDDVASTLDPRAWDLLWKAAQYDRIAAQAAGVTRGALKPDPDGKIRVVRAQATAPRSTPTTQRRAAVGSAFAKLTATGSLDDAVAALQARRANRAG